MEVKGLNKLQVSIPEQMGNRAVQVFLLDQMEGVDRRLEVSLGNLVGPTKFRFSTIQYRFQVRIREFLYERPLIL